MVADELIGLFAMQVLLDRWISYETAQASLISVLLSFDASEFPLFQDHEVPRSQAFAGPLVECVCCGVSPMEMRRAKLFVLSPYHTQSSRYHAEAERLNDPIQLAAFFAYYGLDQQATDTLAFRSDLTASIKFIELRNTQTATRTSPPPTPGQLFVAGATGSVGPASRPTWFLPFDFEDVGLTRVSCSAYDNLYLDGAFEDEPYHSMLANHLFTVSHLGILYKSRGKDLPRRVQAEALRHATKASSFDKIAPYASLLDEENLAHLYRDKPLIGLLSPSTPTQVFVAGLRKLASSAESTQAEVLQRLGRAPTIEEIQAVRNVGVVSILDKMPWAWVEKITEDPHVSALLLPYLGKAEPEILRRCLTKHDKRLTPYSEIKPSGIDLLGWKDIMGRLYQRWTRAIEFRKKLREVVKDPWIAFLAVLCAETKAGPQSPMAMMLKHFSRWSELESVLQTYASPDPRSLVTAPTAST